MPCCSVARCLAGNKLFQFRCILSQRDLRKRGCGKGIVGVQREAIGDFLYKAWRSGKMIREYLRSHHASPHVQIGEAQLRHTFVQ
jgi:hypothetical protein